MSQAQSQQTMSVPNARGGPITDTQLEQGIVSALVLQQDPQSVDPRELRIHYNLVSLMAANLFRECLLRRQAMDVINDMSDVSNVLSLHRN